MFKKFDEKENVSNCIQLKTSVIKGIKNQLLDQFPNLNEWLNQIMPKKEPVKIVRCHEHVEILMVNGELLFFRQREGPFYPSLRLLHKYPFILPHQQVDKGAIKFVLSGANIMCPGLTSPGAKLYPAETDTIVVSFQWICVTLHFQIVTYSFKGHNGRRQAACAQCGSHEDVSR
ncbi:malignant T-cell-amplified sequence 1 isoform X2 [Xyrauchen texanus]|uniref:malignant T-cell-amplified sequence 1 isoform X2 n=1 Tax=Xyrauchen texanus TaxID=154827 RepID=UPI00224218D1|nr:malignant T-cell-amplified sequence 1 isoform X2 [Xyrauchen texanus]